MGMQSDDGLTKLANTQQIRCVSVCRGLFLAALLIVTGSGASAAPTARRIILPTTSGPVADWRPGSAPRPDSGLFPPALRPDNSILTNTAPSSYSRELDSISAALDQVGVSPDSSTDVFEFGSNTQVPSTSSNSFGSSGSPLNSSALGNGPFAGLGNQLQGGGGNLMNNLLQGVALFAMLQDLFSTFGSGGSQFSSSNTGQSALMAASNLLGLLSGGGGGMLPFGGGSNSFTSAAAQRIGESTRGVPGTQSGNLACAWVVNDVFRSITGSTIVGPGGNSLSVYDTVRAMEGNPQMFREVSREQAISSGRDYISAWNPAWGGSASHIVYGRGGQGIGNSSGSRSIQTQGIGGSYARYFVINR